jgi:hypothetical protein
MRNLARRLSAVEARLCPAGQARGTYEIHFRQAGHASEAERPGQHACAEPGHGPNCGVQVFAIDAPIRRMLVLESPWAPLT